MNRLTAISQAIALVALSVGANAQTAPSPTNLKDAVERAILQNPEVKLRFHNFEASQEERKSAEGGWLPKVDLEAATSSNQTLKPYLSSTQSYNGNRASIQLRQTLFDGFATLNDVRRLSYAQQSAFYELQSASNQTGLEAARAYLDVIRYRELVEMAADNLITHQEVHGRLNQKVQAGVGRRVDLEQASGRMALAESNWLTEVSNLHDVSARYQRLVGDTPAAELPPPPPLAGQMPQSVEFLRGAVAKNPDFLASVATLRAFRADLNLRKAAMYPTLEFRARQSYEANQSGVIGDFRDSTLELVLNYNLFRGGSDITRIKQYAAKLNSAFDLRDKACRDVWQTGQIAYNDSMRIASQIKLLQQHELSTSKARVAYQQQFDIGQRSLLDLLDTENEYYQARRALANAEYDLQLAHARVLASSGSLLEALKLQTLSSTLPEVKGGQENDDEMMECSSHTLPSIEKTPVPVAVAKPSPVEPAPLPVALPAPVKAPTPDPAAQACMQVPQSVQTWLAAWNSKDATGYLSHYAENFVPAMGLSRSAWETLRKKRIGKQGDIQATVSDIKPLTCDAKSAEVAFKQEYGSVDYRDSVEKTLSLVRVGDAWKIVRETVTKGRTF
ncbi:TolC family outer membrane protein [Rhodoferax saidenbachensis]|uniref:Adhesin transport system outer membrane protein n=1 Tax=Rhodoferax saidenbachensis TaxID=1484693 RepID=A0ABU1ZNI3_9BURK|nr:TolC family outer membrane protein [Rhodoferax saidenbachensis]MDR7307107.1 adhesin transport system outer membrane protein [Rhodoferax saidenbachensis]